jgi:hypothetical protein
MQKSLLMAGGAGGQIAALGACAVLLGVGAALLAVGTALLAAASPTGAVAGATGAASLRQLEAEAARSSVRRACGVLTARAR